MRERVERTVELGFLKNEKKVVDDMERLTDDMKSKGFSFIHSETDPNLNHVTLIFEREIFPDE
ncbi:MAG: hypothetical protein A2293_05975 [Elusimicrobia bacterium RIFOXYB2_FULL_49_7]|nr:MAG: hypothetical protein A2293_05975 [Elusimicrobia bacterium RIFOXYB2_FULL_49_7]